jgi:hypothetical protein
MGRGLSTMQKRILYSCIMRKGQVLYSTLLDEYINDHCIITKQTVSNGAFWIKRASLEASLSRAITRLKKRGLATIETVVLTSGRMRRMVFITDDGTRAVNPGLTDRNKEELTAKPGLTDSSDFAQSTGAQ